MKVYADTSVLIAWFHPADQFARPVTKWCRARSLEFCWNPLLRLELRHNLRRLTSSYAATAWQAYRASESSKRLRMGVPRASTLIEWGDELSSRHAAEASAGTWDCAHVAAAQHDRAEIFITCDVAQADLARKARIPKVHLFT